MNADLHRSSQAALSAFPCVPHWQVPSRGWWSRCVVDSSSPSGLQRSRLMEDSNRVICPLSPLPDRSRTGGLRRDLTERRVSAGGLHGGAPGGQTQTPLVSSAQLIGAAALLRSSVCLSSPLHCHWRPLELRYNRSFQSVRIP